MTQVRQGIGLILILSLACGAAAAPALPSARATLTPTVAGGTAQGTAALTEQAEGLRVAIQVLGLSPGEHGIHIHEKGDCGEGGNAAGGHFNPAGAPHGFLPKDGAQAHPGDMGNITVQEDGTGTLELTLPGVKLQDVVGRAIILHEKRDDFGQPTGNAGGRIGCGVIEGA